MLTVNREIVVMSKDTRKDVDMNLVDHETLKFLDTYMTYDTIHDFIDPIVHQIIDERLTVKLDQEHREDEYWDVRNRVCPLVKQSVVREIGNQLRTVPGLLVPQSSFGNHGWITFFLQQDPLIHGNEEKCDLTVRRSL